MYLVFARADAVVGAFLPIPSWRRQIKTVIRSIKSPSCIDNATAQAALRQGQFVPYFQPLVELRSGKLSGFEVLARWNHPHLGLVLPDRFIPLAQKHGWIDELTQEILGKAMASSCYVPAPLTLSVNISPVQLRNGNLSEMIETIAQQTEFPLERLVIEITESALIGNLDCARRITKGLKNLGCKLSLDDFGTGYSSLRHLQTLPFDELKVDRSFVSSMTERRESRKIVAAVVSLGQSLSMCTVAEGIESQEQAEMMLWLGCDLGQGWFYGKPAPCEDLASVVSLRREAISSDSIRAWRSISEPRMDGPLSLRLAQLQAVYDGAPVGLAFVDRGLRYVSLNQRLAEMNGATVEDHLRKKVSEMIPELFPEVEPFIRRALHGEAIADVEVQFGSAGHTRLISYQPARDEAGEVVGVCIAIIDITKRKRAEEALRESEEHYRNALELNPHGLCVGDADGLRVEEMWR